MPKSRSLEEDKQILQKKVKEGLSKNDNSKGDSSLRSLRKRLRRAQRRMRSLKAREQRASPPKAASSA